MENNYINLNYMADREKDITIKDLKTAIRKYKREECKPYYQLNRAGLIEYVKQYEIPVKIAKKTKTKKETKPKPKTILKVKPVKQDKPPGMDQPIEEVDVPKVNIPQISEPKRKRVPIKIKETGTAHLSTKKLLKLGDEILKENKDLYSRQYKRKRSRVSDSDMSYEFYFDKFMTEFRVRSNDKDLTRTNKDNLKRNIRNLIDEMKKQTEKEPDTETPINKFAPRPENNKSKAVKQDKPPGMDQLVDDVDVPKVKIGKISEPKRKPKTQPKKTVERKKLTREEEAIIKEQERNRREEKEDKEREEKERNKQKKRNEKEEEERKAKAIKAFQEAEKLKESDRKKKRKMMTQQEKDAEDYERKRKKREEKSRAKYVSKADRDAEEKREKEKKERESKQKREQAKKRMGKKTEDEEMEEIKKKLEEFRKKRAKEKEKKKKK